MAFAGSFGGGEVGCDCVFGIWFGLEVVEGWVMVDSYCTIAVVVALLTFAVFVCFTFIA